MGDRSAIQWTDASWNPVTGCLKVSPGCAHCYAERVAIRLWPSQYPSISMGPRSDARLNELIDRHGYEVGVAKAHEENLRPRAFTDVQCHEDRLDQPLRWKKPRKVFVNSMSDLFHEDVPDAFIDRVFAVMALAPRHTFQVLTKRAERMRDYMIALDRAIRIPTTTFPRWRSEAEQILNDRSDTKTIVTHKWPLPNVWLGVSVENQRFADERIPLLLQTPAAVRFISAEPLLGAVDLSKWMPWRCGCRSVDECFHNLQTLDWVIVGGESGKGARPSELAWYRSLRDQCNAAGVPFFLKQLGARPTVPAGRQQHWEWGGAIGREARFEATDPLYPSSKPWRVVLRDSHGGEMAEWPEDLRVRQFPEAPRA